MKDWAIDYILHVLEKKDWSANRLATEAGVAASTINRPLREADNWDYRLSRKTIMKIQAASGIDPTPFIPKGFSEEVALFSHTPPPKIGSSEIAARENPPPRQPPHNVNEVRITVSGPTAQIVATVNKEGIESLRKKLDALESILDTQ
ncbi:hypothetical protein [Shimia aestuarii]|uniref:hypothetical protein n=1 Tax=Shimia aestuarii TaxID=254406 RepID=UPI001FB34CE9|nr:hypothetical protein [Shimia aestuarii]